MLGTVSAIGASLLFGVAIFLVFGELPELGEQLFEGLAALTATFVLSYMIFWMTKRAHTLRSELEQRVDLAVSRGQFFGIVSLVFVAVFREGLETVLFLTTQLTTDPAGTIAGLLLASFVILALSWILMKGIYRLGISRFFQVTSVLLIIFAAGLIGLGVHELIEASETAGVQLGVLGQPAFNINPPLNPDGTYPLLHEKGALGSIFAALVGYTGSPEWLRIIVYIAYWLVMGAYFIRNFRKEKPIVENP